jgi:hypothetical protein
MNKTFILTSFTIILLFIIFALFIKSQIAPIEDIGFLEEATWENPTLEPMLGASITTIQATDKISDSRTTINDNFSALNAGLHWNGNGDYITPSTTSYGILINSSSTVIGNFSVDGHSTTTGTVDAATFCFSGADCFTGTAGLGINNWSIGTDEGWITPSTTVGFVVSASSTINSLIIETNATTTGSQNVGELFINSEGFTDLTGTGLTNSAGTLVPNLTGGTGITFSNPTVSFDCSEVEGTGIDCATEAITLDATGDWTGTFDSLQGSAYLDARNHTQKDWSSFSPTAISPSSTSVGIFVQASSTIEANLRIQGNATTTGSFAFPSYANCNLDTDANGLLVCGSDAGASASTQAWDAPWLNAITPTNTSAGIFVRASSTIAANFRVDGNATTTGSFYVGTSNLVVMEGGNIGIGTTTPKDFKFQIAGDIGPDADNLYELGSANLRWKDIHLGPGSVNLYSSYTDSSNYEKASFSLTSSDQLDTNTDFDAADESGFEQEDLAYSVTLTPNETSSSTVTLTLGSGNWNATHKIKKGCRVVGNGGKADITATPAGQSTIVASTTVDFTNTDAIASGSWNLYCTDFDSSGAVELSQAVVSGDPIDSDTKLLLHLDGPDDSTDDADFIDSSGQGHTVTQTANAKLEDTTKKFGDTSVYFDGTGDYLTVPDHADWDFGSGDFTIDMWVRFDSLAATQTLYRQSSGGKDTNGADYINIYVPASPTDKIYFQNDAASVNNLHWSLSPDFAIDTWYHVAIVRSGNTWYGFIDGVSKTLSLDAGNYSNSLPNVASDLWIAAGPGASNVEGYVDELRITKGVARWTSNFTPPTGAYGAGGTITPSDEFYTINTTDTNQLDSSDWTDINGITVTETLNSQSINYSVSFDDRTTWSIASTTQSNWRDIVKHDSGTWKYNSNTTWGSETWTATATNTQAWALDDAYDIWTNVMTGTYLNALTDTDWEETNGWSQSVNTIDFAMGLKTTSADSNPQIDSIVVDHEGGGTQNELTLGTYSEGTGSNRAIKFRTSYQNEGFYIGTDGNVGIGTTTPDSLFTINSPNSTSNLFQVSSSTNQNIFLINNDGNVGIGTTSPSQVLSVSGNALADAWLTYSPMYSGTALDSILSIDCIPNTEDGDWCDIEHSSLPNGVNIDNKYMSIDRLAVFNTKAIQEIASVIDLTNTPTTTPSIGALVADRIKAKYIETENLKIRAENATASGITIYDSKTDEPYCLYTEYGVPMTRSGECDEVLGGNEPQPVIIEEVIEGNSTTTEEAIEEEVEETSTSTEPIIEEPVIEKPIIEPEPDPEPEPVVEEPIIEPGPAIDKISLIAFIIIGIIILLATTFQM